MKQRTLFTNSLPDESVNMRLLLVGIALLMLSMYITSCSSTSESTNIPNAKYIVWQQDKYLWVSESDRLIRWDIQTKGAKTFKGISGQLLVDSKNTLWVFDENKVSHLDNTQEWEHFTPDGSFVGGDIFSIAELDGYIWLGTSGLSRYSQQNKSWEILFQIPPGSLPTPVPQDSIVETLMEGVYSIVSGSQGGIWIGTSRGLAYVENDFQRTWGNEVLDTDGVRCLLKASDEELWVCTDNGVGRWSGVQWMDFHEGLRDPILLVQGEGEEVWVITRESGVARWNGTSWDRWTHYEGLAGPRPTSLVVSTTDHNVWVGTKTGISRWNGKQWRTYKTFDGLNSDYINVLFQDPTGTLWAGTFGGGVNYYDPIIDRWQPFPGE
jgi:ligand-binding sensor domain-containing protein